MIVQQFAAIILAAGRSARLGTPKQLLIYQHKTLLQHAIDEAELAGANPIIVVTGARDFEGIEHGNVLVVKNDDWEEGMASSIRAGIKKLESEWPDVDAALITVCDQPFADQALLTKLISAQAESGRPVVASQYGEIAGTPALFHRSFFQLLLQLKGDKGARQLIADHKELVAFVGFPNGMTDIDTLDDYEALLRETKLT